MTAQPLSNRSNGNRGIAKYLLAFAAAILFILVGLWMSYDEISSVWRKNQIWDQSYNWPTSTGIVVGTDIGRDYYTRQDQDQIGSSTYYFALVTYEYSIDGKEYISRNLDFRASMSRDVSQAREIADQYSIGEEIVVYYNPNDYKEAVLIPGCEGCERWPSIENTCTGIFGIILVLGLFLWSFINILNRISIWINKKVET